MFRLFSLLFLSLVLSTTVYSQTSSLYVLDPQRRAKTTRGIISDAEIEVTPEGAYARVDMVFTINAKNTYKATDTLEAVLNFGLPQGSYIHDSWLWLDQSTIIKADIIEKNRAISIYEGIVKRRRDPSLLIKTSATTYKLNVFPMTMAYSRKVKISYTTPINWQENTSKITLPKGLFLTSDIPPTLTIKVNKNQIFNNPEFILQDYNQHIQSTTGPQDVLTLSPSDYTNDGITLQYKSTLTNQASIITYPTGNNAGVYQMIIPPSVIDKKSNRCISIILDYQNTKYSIYSYASMKQQVQAALLNNYNSTDSFNVFYYSNHQVMNISSSWAAINKINVNQAFNSIPNAVVTPSIAFEDLLTVGMSFCSGKSKHEAEVLLVSNNEEYTSNQQKTNTLFDNIKTAIGGYNHKINVINYSRRRLYINRAYHYANDILYNKLTLTTNGQMFRYGSYTYKYINGQYVYTYNLNINDCLNNISFNAGIATAAYNIILKPNNGFSFSEYKMFKNQKINFSNNYIVLGRYKGSIGNGTNIDIQAVTTNKTINKTVSNINVIPGSKGLITDWVNHYIEEIEDYNNPAYTQEIIDSSINNRVLCYKTAFLAVETGDTLNTNVDDNQVLSVIEANSTVGATIKAYPNPFNNQITIELPPNAEQIEVYDILGRKVFAKTLDKNDKKYVWNGMNNNGDALSSGTYIITIRTKNGNKTLKVLKQ